jgi:hypothetical protein
VTPEKGYLMPVMAVPLTKNFWPRRKAIRTGSRDMMDMANREPQEVEAVVFTKERSAMGTVNILGS